MRFDFKTFFFTGGTFLLFKSITAVRPANHGHDGQKKKGPSVFGNIAAKQARMRKINELK